MKVISRKQAMMMARMCAVRSDDCIDANELTYDDVTVCGNGDVSVILYDQDKSIAYKFLIKTDPTGVEIITMVWCSNE